MHDIIHELQDLKYLNWIRTRKSSGTAGSFLKSYDDTGSRKKYYKLSDFDPVRGIIGHECINEIVAQRLLQLLEIEHLAYTLLHATVRIDEQDYETYLCESEDFKNDTEGKVAFEDYYLIEKEPGETPLAFFRRMGWERYAYEALLTDYLILNRDRHGANIEVLRNARAKTMRIAPLFDHGLSLIYSCMSDKEAKKYDVLEDKKCQNFIGGYSCYENLSLIKNKKDVFLNGLSSKDKKAIFDDLNNVISEVFIDKIWEMIYERYKIYEEL